MIFGRFRYWIEVYVHDFFFGEEWILALSTNDKERADRLLFHHLKAGDTVRLRDSWLLN